MLSRFEGNAYPTTGDSQPIDNKVIYGVFVATVFMVLVSVIFLSEQSDTAAGETAAVKTAMAEKVAANLPQSGVENPVTAVLPNFRSYDTLLEIAVLLIVAVALMPSNPRPVTVNPTTDRDNALPVLRSFARWFAPTTVVMAGYLLWTGAYAPGGAFQAGAILAGAGILVLQLQRLPIAIDGLLMQLLLIIGLVVFIGIAIYTYIANGTVLQYSPSDAGWQILVIEIAATLSITAILVMLYISLASPSDPSTNKKEGA